jgi:hypothetical protein
METSKNKNLSIITAQGYIAAAHSLPEIPEKWLCVGRALPRTIISWDFSGTFHRNTISVAL